ncbi:hypothetical protein HZ326_24448 [Fusarium oxysporum f. sp. albedinis]|nr:hypothetical protein HZ326_24448 [Fusarium oxysporum f. sp. albedinis]
MLHQAILGLVASTVAIDIAFYSNKQEGDSGTFWATVGFHAVPLGWNIQGLAYKHRGSEACQGLPIQADHSHGNGDFFLRHTGTSFLSAEYYFTDNIDKRAAGQQCVGPERVSRLSLEDGSMYDIADMSDDDLKELLCSNITSTFQKTRFSNKQYLYVIINGTAAAGMPQHTHLHQLK